MWPPTAPETTVAQSFTSGPEGRGRLAAWMPYSGDPLPRLRKGRSPNRRLSPPRRWRDSEVSTGASEVCSRARDAPDAHLKRGGARGRRAATDEHVHGMCTACARRVHGMYTACARHVHSDVTPRACTACARLVRCVYVHVALHMHQASAPRRACATRAGSPRTLERCSRPWRRCDR